MAADLLIKEDIVFGDRVELIALCSKVEVKQNLSTTGSYREIYYLHGKDGAFVSAILFKLNSVDKVDMEAFTDAPIMVTGTIGEYRGVNQIHIESISPITHMLDKNDLLAEMVDTTILDTINEILFERNSMYNLSFQHLKPAQGLEESTAGTFALRLRKLLEIGRIHYSTIIDEYIGVISLLSPYYLETEGTLRDRFEIIRATESDLVKALLFVPKEYPEYEEFVKLHHLIMKPRGCVLEILDSAFTTNSNSGGDI